MRKTVFVFFIGLALLGFKRASAQIMKEYSSFYPAVGLQLGTHGIGIEGAYPLSGSFGLRVAGNFFPKTKVVWGDNKVVSVDRSNAAAFLDWQPLFGKGSWIARKWIVTGGFGYYFENTLNRYRGGTAVPDQPLDYQFEFSRARPYLGTGLNGVKLAHRINFSAHVGYFFPTESTKIILHEKDPAELPILEDRAQSFPNNIAPGVNVQVGVSYLLF